jgi:hypothetical protein
MQSFAAGLPTPVNAGKTGRIIDSAPKLARIIREKANQIK